MCERYCTLSSSQQIAEAYLYGLDNPEQAREQILTARDTIAIQNKHNPDF